MITVKANGFLQKMVRNIAGLLIEVGSGKREPYWAKKVLLHRRRSINGATAPPSGLYLVAVDYPQEFGIPLQRRKIILIGSKNFCLSFDPTHKSDICILEKIVPVSCCGYSKSQNLWNNEQG